jgi:hypothetical protein
VIRVIVAATPIGIGLRKIILLAVLIFLLFIVLIFRLSVIESIHYMLRSGGLCGNLLILNIIILLFVLIVILVMIVFLFVLIRLIVVLVCRPIVTIVIVHKLRVVGIVIKL